MQRWDPRDAVAIVTGASSGIGYELSILLAKRGATVIAVARREDRLQYLVEQARETSGKVIPFAGDITDLETRDAIIQPS